MKTFLLLSAALTLVSCAPAARDKEMQASTNPTPKLMVGGEETVSLQRSRTGDQNHPEFLSVQVLPGRGMNVYQVRAFVPGKGEINVLSSPALEETAKLMNGGAEDVIGNKSFSAGGAILVPYANRIRGKISADGKTIETQILGKTVTLPANWSGKKPGAEKYAMHGLILDARVPDVKTSDDTISGVYHAGDFGGHWVSSTDLTFQVGLKQDSVQLSVTAKNVGNEDLPIGIGWHPYFALPSGDRTQARLHLPADRRALANNYDDVLPTGEVAPVAGTKFDFTAPGGAALGSLYMDDSFVGVKKDAAGHTVSEVIDPAAKYGLRITALSPQVTAIQVYAPPDKQFVVLEPQFNWANPFGKEWRGQKTNMVILKPGESVNYAVQLELFVP